ncbi:sensor histidine kinase [Limnothrix redekei]|uniref:histidine kinase n=1 Tax=Limnothrix redekei LRLZ20PSL1 TaxID=3112953 RepID=A0ABW7C7W1_9CYAN
MSASVSNEFILVVDDNPTNLAVLSEALNSAGLRFRVAIDGESALAQVDRNLPDLILLDVQMPGIDGFETCRRLKANPLTQSIPIIFTTAFSDTDNKAKGFALGAVDYIPKPFDQTEVLARLQVHLKLKKLTESLEHQVHDRTAALQKMQVQLVQQEKLSSLGEMIAGIAHEINNPINFIASNVDPLREHINNMAEILRIYQKEHPQPSPELAAILEDLEPDFIFEDSLKIINSLTLGAERIRGISTSLRTFSRSDTETKIPANLHEGLDSTLMILQHRLKSSDHRPAISILKSYGELPLLPCYPGQINQVFMNLLANAIDALEESALKGQTLNSELQIQITTQTTSDQQIVVCIADNGIGMNELVKQRLFEPLFTTKPVGKGTGLGLAIAHQIVSEKHSGTLEVQSELGRGTQFLIRLPINPK